MKPNLDQMTFKEKLIYGMELNYKNLIAYKKKHKFDCNAGWRNC